MKNKIVKIMALVLALVTSLTGSAYAGNSSDYMIVEDNWGAEDDYYIEGTPNLSRWSYTSSVSEGLSISSSGTATMSSIVTGYQDLTTKIVIFFDLQKYDDGMWKQVKTYRDTTNGWHTVEEHVYSGLDKGYTYRLRCKYYVYSGSSYDYFVRYTAEKKY